MAQDTISCAVMAQKPQRIEYQEQLRSAQQNNNLVVYDTENGDAWLSSDCSVEIKA